MSLPKSPKPAKLVIGIFLKDKTLVSSITDALVEKFGAIDMLSEWFDFDYTNYYEPEMGKPLVRRVFAFKTLVMQDELADIKLFTNSIEARLAMDGNRRVNIDPGYLLLERFVLATGKNYTHRIYLGKGIFADLTLIFQKGQFCELPWTYRDYLAPDMLDFLTHVRNKYKLDLNASQLT